MNARVVTPLSRLLDGALFRLPAADQARLIDRHRQESQPVLLGVLAAGAAMLALFGLGEALGWVPGIGRPPFASLAVAVALVIAAGGVQRIEAAARRYVLIAVVLVVLGTYLSIPAAAGEWHLAYRVALFNLVALTLLTIAVRLPIALVLVGGFVVLSIVRVLVSGPPVSGLVPYALFEGASLAFGLLLRRFRMDLAVQSYRTRHLLVRQATVDALTGLLNRAGWNRQAAPFMARALAAGRHVAGIFFDVDRFKRINDQHGHATGDEVLKMVGDAICAVDDERCVTARLGGEEFACMLAVNDAAAAEAFAQRVVDEVRRRGAEIACTISAGVAHRLADEDVRALMRRADEALYGAKHAGRDRVCVSPD